MQGESMHFQILAIGLALKNLWAAIGASEDCKELWDLAGDSELDYEQKDACISWISDLLKICEKENGGSQ